MPETPGEMTSRALVVEAVGEEALGAWRERVRASEEMRKLHHGAWEADIAAYEGQGLRTSEGPSVNVNKHFSTTKLKSAQLFFKTGEVTLSPLGPLEAQPQKVAVAQAILNSKLGVQGIRAKGTVRKALFHVLTCGVGPTKIGYEAFTRPVPVEPVPGAVGAQAQVAQQVVSERWFWESFSPKQLLLPVEFEGDGFDQAAWVGWTYRVDRAVAARRWGLEDAEVEAAGTKQRADETLLSGEKQGRLDSATQVVATEIWYRRALFEAAEVNPEVVWTVTLLEGLDDPVVEHRPSPYQSVGSDGRLTPDSMLGYPIHPLTLNYVTDRAFPPSDCAMIRPQVEELCRFRGQMVVQRDTSIPMRWYDANQMPPETVAKIEAGQWQGLLATNGPGQTAIGEIARAQYPRENFTAQEWIERDLEQTLGVGANQRGSTQDTERTATELQLVQANVSVRLEDERNEVLDWYVRGVAKFWSLIQRFADQQDWVEVEVPVPAEPAAPAGDGAPASRPVAPRTVMPWTKADIQGRYAFTIRPDSTARVDAGQERKFWLDVYNFLRKDPKVNPDELLKHLATVLNVPLDRMLAKPQPKGPEPPAVSFRFSGDDLDPTQPKFALVLSILEQGGFRINPQAVQVAVAHAAKQGQILAGAGQPQPGPALTGAPPPGPRIPDLTHGGMADKTELINKHQEERTGRLPGVRP